MRRVNPQCWHFHPLVVVSRYRDSQQQVGEIYFYLFSFRPNIYKYGCLNTLLLFLYLQPPQLKKTYTLHTYNIITARRYNLAKICVHMVEFLFKKSSLYNTSCSESTTSSLAEYFWEYLNFESTERRGDRPMSSRL